jgi:hypothetical protein
VEDRAEPGLVGENRRVAHPRVERVEAHAEPAAPPGRPEGEKRAQKPLRAPVVRSHGRLRRRSGNRILLARVLVEAAAFAAGPRPYRAGGWKAEAVGAEFELVITALPPFLRIRVGAYPWSRELSRTRHQTRRRQALPNTSIV